jgi:hypothetical protein
MNDDSLLWWPRPGEYGGMSQPFLTPERRLAMGADGLRDHDDELPVLWDEGIRSVICLLNIPSDQAVYETAGFAFACVPIRDGGAPTPAQTAELTRLHAVLPRPIGVHCYAGLGRTGTVLGLFLILDGLEPEAAIVAIRETEPFAIETRAQERYLLAR